jgi:hypothetical protein
VNKLFFSLFFLSLACFGMQDSLATNNKVIIDNNQVKKIVFNQNDVKVDSDSIEAKNFEQNFKSKYTSDDFVYEYKSKEKNAWDRFKEWLASKFNALFDIGNRESSMNIVEILLKTIAVLIVVFVIYLIVKSILNKEGQWIFGKNSDKKLIYYDAIEKNIKNVDFEKLIQSTIKSGEKRLAIRYYYLWLLKKMSVKEIIVWDIEKTNSDYLYEIKNPKLKDDFAYTSYLYNNIWYGEFDLDDVTFDKAKTTFDKTIKSIGNG